jgi:pimeloyl-ACP methyl ester carboxylesterase
MKIKVLILFLVCCITRVNSCSQDVGTWGAFARAVPAKEYAGKKFRIEAAVKLSAIDSAANAEIWVRIDKADQKTGFFYNMMDKPIYTKEWKLYSISGKIDKAAQYVVFGGMYHKRGIFFFDNFKFFIENEQGVMEEVPLVNEDFEEDNFTSKNSWGYNPGLNPYHISLTEQEYYSGKKCCKVDGSHIAASKKYGDNDSIGKYATVNGIRLYYEEYGKGDPLLLLHGNSGSIGAFEKQIPELSKQFRVIAVDTRGQGKSGDDGKTYTYDLFAEDMNGLLDYLHLDSVNVVGWSDGGNTGLIMAMRYPAKVKKLVTMGANVFIDNTVVGKWVFKEVHKQIKELKGDTSAWANNRRRLNNLLLTEPRHTFAELAAIKCPVLVMAGEKDIIEEGHTKSIAANISRSTLMIFPKETHYLPVENPVKFNGAVIEFLKKVN